MLDSSEDGLWACIDGEAANTAQGSKDTLDLGAVYIKFVHLGEDTFKPFNLGGLCEAL